MLERILKKRESLAVTHKCFCDSLIRCVKSYFLFSKQLVFFTVGLYVTGITSASHIFVGPL